MANNYRNPGCGASSNGIYFLAFIGAAIFYIQNANTLLEGVIGILKALVWPAILIYKILEFLPNILS